jgi:hypothetical protein
LAQPFDKSVQIFDEIFGSNLGLIVIIHVHIGSMFREWCQGAIRGGGGPGVSLISTLLLLLLLLDGYSWYSKYQLVFVVEIWSSWKLFVSVGNQKKIFYNFNTATHGGLKNIIFELFI